jgi:hypothetical protein
MKREVGTEEVDFNWTQKWTFCRGYYITHQLEGLSSEKWAVPSLWTFIRHAAACSSMQHVICKVVQNMHVMQY